MNHAIWGCLSQRDAFGTGEAGRARLIQRLGKLLVTSLPDIFKYSSMNPFLLFGMPGGPEIFIILIIIVLLFGAKKIPDLMKGVGKGIKEFKDATKGDSSDNGDKENPEQLKGNSGN